ncbi:MAG: hypothetical protein AAGA27_02230 [Pseudomonadota bacterium]
MKKLLIIFAIPLFTGNVHAAQQQTPHYSDILVIGDSQSDIANGPENQTLIDPIADKIATNLYVPISNPVNPQKDNILPSLSKKGFKFPVVSNHFIMTLPPQADICASGKCSKRKYLPLNWVSYFLYNAQKKNLITSPIDLRPWIIQYKQPITNASLNQSVDYAWYSAMSGNTCNRFDYTPTPCTSTKYPNNLSNSLYYGQKYYRDNQSKNNAKANIELREKTVIIPGAQQQVALFKSDLKNHRIKVNSDTLYIVWSGSNDISLAFSTYLGIHILQFIKQIRHTIPDKIANTNNQQSVVSQLINLGAKNILVVGQYNLGFTPTLFTMLPNVIRNNSVMKSIVISFVGFLTSCFNASLKKNLAAYHLKYPNIHIAYVDIATPIKQQLSRNNAVNYYNTLGQRCEDTAVSDIKNGDAVNCYDAPSHPLGWWNNSHVATQLNQLIAYSILRQAEKL